MVFQFEHIGLDEQEGKGKWDLKPLDVLELKSAVQMADRAQRRCLEQLVLEQPRLASNRLPLGK